MKEFNNQYATQRLLSEESVTGGSAPANTAATFKAGTGMEYTTKKKNEVKDKEPKLAGGKAEVYPQKKWGWKPAPSIPNRKSKGGFQYKQMFEDIEEGTLQPVDTSKDQLSPIEYQQALQYKDFKPYAWYFDDQAKKYIRLKKGSNKAEIAEAGQKFFIQVDVRDARKALSVIQDDPFLSKSIIKDASDVYSTNNEEAAEALVDALKQQGIRSKNNVDDYLNEAMTYNKFKKEAATRSNKDSLHEALKSINKKLHEINKLMEYSTNMKMELDEEYSPRTGKVVNKLAKQLAEIYKKVKSLQ